MKGLPRSNSRAAPLTSQIQTAAIRIKDLELSVADVVGFSGFGTVAISGLPAGNMLFLGAVAYLQLSSASAGITATFTGNYSVGTTATADNIIAGTDADLIPSTAMGAAAAKVSPVVRGASTDALGGGIFDNTDGLLKLNLNVIIDDAAISAASVFTCQGVVHISYVMLGDD